MEPLRGKKTEEKAMLLVLYTVTHRKDKGAQYKGREIIEINYYGSARAFVGNCYAKLLGYNGTQSKRLDSNPVSSTLFHMTISVRRCAVRGKCSMVHCLGRRRAGVVVRPVASVVLHPQVYVHAGMSVEPLESYSLEYDSEAVHEECWRTFTNTTAHFPVGSLPDIRVWESCLAVPVSPPPLHHSGALLTHLASPSSPLKTSPRYVTTVRVRTNKRIISGGSSISVDYLSTRDCCVSAFVLRGFDFDSRESRYGHYSPPSQARFPAESPPDFRMWERARQCRWSTGLLADLPFPTPLHSGTAPYRPRFALIGSQDLYVKSRPNYSTLLSTLRTQQADIVHRASVTFYFRPISCIDCIGLEHKRFAHRRAFPRGRGPGENTTKMTSRRNHYLVGTFGCGANSSARPLWRRSCSLQHVGENKEEMSHRLMQEAGGICENADHSGIQEETEEYEKATDTPPKFTPPSNERITAYGGGPSMETARPKPHMRKDPASGSHSDVDSQLESDIDIVVRFHPEYFRSTEITSWKLKHRQKKSCNVVFRCVKRAPHRRESVGAVLAQRLESSPPTNANQRGEANIGASTGARLPGDNFPHSKSRIAERLGRHRHPHQVRHRPYERGSELARVVLVVLHVPACYSRVSHKTKVTEYAACLDGAFEKHFPSWMSLREVSARQAGRVGASLAT
ncbi:hypothetical protein PR048_015579 [Dryococelus australis]|uniref:Uncharacterized protein n=1 Tax=Dryococelus australis TaxID=614101 RepID=A0ABQ9HHB8_9NEOP|nr:hypothetical protein PR048_015579 [Dryococelus australis]